jgi:hypothetical protein
MPLFPFEPLREQRIFATSSPVPETRLLVAKSLEAMGFAVSERDSKLVAHRGSREEWWRDGLHRTPQRLELLPVQAVVEIGEILGGSLARITLTDTWKGGIRQGAEEVYAPCFLAVVEELCRSAHLVEAFPGSGPEMRVLPGRSRSSGRARAFRALALSVVLLTLAVLFLQDVLVLIVSRMFR